MNTKKDNEFYLTAIAWCLVLSAVLLFSTAVLFDNSDIRDAKVWLSK